MIAEPLAITALRAKAIHSPGLAQFAARALVPGLSSLVVHGEILESKRARLGFSPAGSPKRKLRPLSRLP